MVAFPPTLLQYLYNVLDDVAALLNRFFFFGSVSNRMVTHKYRHTTT